MRLINCPKCGCRCSDQNNCCPECGFELNEYFTTKTDRPTRIRSFLLFVSGILILICVLLTVLFVFRFTHKDNTVEKPVPPDITEPIAENNTEKIESDDITSDTSTIALNTDNNTTVINNYVIDNMTQYEDDSEEEVPSYNDQKSENDNSSSTDVTSVEDIKRDYSVSDVSGVYSGDDHEILVLDKDGLAYYYCIQIECTDLQCPWYIEGNKVYIDLARLHCIVYADITENELIFKSNSLNWNTELFTRINVEPKDYLHQKLVTHDPNAILNIDGTITYSLDNITYIVPKTYLDYEDAFDHEADCSAFVEPNADLDYASTIMFYRENGDNLSDINAEKNIKKFALNFYDDVQIGKHENISIAHNSATLYNVTGYQNSGFQALQAMPVTGYIAVFYNNKSSHTNLIMFMQTDNREYDSSDAFLEMLKNAK